MSTPKVENRFATIGGVKNDSPFWSRLTTALRLRGAIGHKVTLAAVSKWSGVGVSAVGKWKTGQGMPDANRIASFADTLDVSVNWLWCGQGEMLLNKKEDEEFRKLLELWNSLSPEQRAFLSQSAQVLKTLADTPKT